MHRRQFIAGTYGDLQLRDVDVPSLECTARYSPQLAAIYGQVHTFRYWRTERKWIFPKERFVTYGPEDERWCRFFGIGREGEVTTEYSCEAALMDVQVQPPLEEIVFANLSLRPMGPVTCKETVKP